MNQLGRPRLPIDKLRVQKTVTLAPEAAKKLAALAKRYDDNFSKAVEVCVLSYSSKV